LAGGTGLHRFTRVTFEDVTRLLEQNIFLTVGRLKLTLRQPSF